MLVTLKDMLADAMSRPVAVPGFNVFGYEDAVAVIRAAEQLGVPAILMTGKVAFDHMPVENLAAILCLLARQSAVPVCVHLDHARDYGLIARAIHSGYTSVMYDGSQLPFAENVENTREIVKLAHALGITVEAEIGSVGYSDPNIAALSEYTDPEEAQAFLAQTGVDALAVAVGSLHRMETQSASIQFDRLAAIQSQVDIPLVIHGSTGVTDLDLARLASTHVAKVNIGTALRQAFGHALRQEMLDNPREFDRIKLYRKPMAAVEAEALRRYRALGFGN